MTIDRRVFHSTSECEALRPEWRSLVSRCRHATPFHTYEWTKANLGVFENDGVCILAFSRSDSEIVGILPLVFRRGRKYLTTRRWIEFAGLPHADYGGILVLPGYELPVAQSLLDFLKTALGGSDGLCLDRLRTDDEFVRVLISTAEKEGGWRVATQLSDNVRRLSAEDYFRTTQQGSGSTSLDKARRKLADRGELRFEVYDRVEQMQDRLEIFVRLHVERFAKQGMQSPLASTVHRHFYEWIVQECAPNGYVWFSHLTCGEATVAMRISLLCNGTLHLYSTCFAQEFAKYSPSVLQLGMLLEYAFHHGVATVDFGIGESPHKQQAGATPQSPLMRVELYRNRLPFLEKRSYDAVDYLCGRWPVFRRAGRRLRKLFPYHM